MILGDAKRGPFALSSLKLLVRAVSCLMGNSTPEAATHMLRLCRIDLGVVHQAAHGFS